MNDRSGLRGMILAAGYGTRLAPVTDHIPKPLLPVGGRPLLDLIIDGFDRTGIRIIGVNTHHLGAMVEDHVAGRPDSSRFNLFPEAEILGTGGALHGARDFLGGAENFLLHNGDVLCDADMKELVEEHLGSGALATLLLTDWPAVNSVVLSAEGRIVSIAGQPGGNFAGETRNLTYTGIGVFSSRILAEIGPGFSSLIDPLVRALAVAPESVRGFAPDDFNWSDLGTLARYLEAQPEGDTGCQGMSLDRITGHGSDRRFWRMGVGDWSAVAMISSPEDEEFDRLTAIADFLVNRNLGGPSLLSVAEAERAVLMEDLGPDSLFSLVQNEGLESESVAEAYRLTVDHLLDMQAATDAARSKCPLAVDRCLDYEALRWETDYFREHFLAGHLGLNLTDLAELDGEFQALAETVAAQPRVLIHRDFQSQNIHLQDGHVRLVDFQGMRLGPLTYDLMSLLLDPYVALDAGLRAGFLNRFAAAAASAGAFTGEDIRAMALAAGLQRIMQALGAYGFLGRVKGKRVFLDYIPAGLAVLREILGELGDSASGKPEVANHWRPGSMPVLERVLDSAE